MPTPLALIALLTLPWSHPAAVTRHVAGWSLSVRTDSFSGGHVCALSRPKIDYQRQALVLRLGRSTDTANALYRIDNGPPQLSRADDMALAQLGFTLRQDDLDNPSGGLVRIPVSRLAGAATVQVETAAYQKPTRFKIDGLANALAAAAAAGCADRDFD